MRGLLGMGLIVGGVYLAYILLSGRTILGIGSGQPPNDTNNGTSNPSVASGPTGNHGRVPALGGNGGFAS